MAPPVRRHTSPLASGLAGPSSFCRPQVDFNVKVKDGPDWGRVVGTELYHHGDDPLENTNIAGSAGKGLLDSLSALLHQHPVWAHAA
jgi:hypothetical protein